MSKINSIIKLIDEDQIVALKNIGINKKEVEKFANKFSKSSQKKNPRQAPDDMEEIYSRNFNTKKYDSFGNPKANRFIKRDGFNF